MVEIACPFCQEAGRVEHAEFVAATFTLRCDACAIEVEVTDAEPSMPLLLAA